MRRSSIVAASSFLAAASLVATAAELHSLDVSREEGRYVLVAETTLGAEPQAIFDVLTDYEDGRFGRISSVYKESDFLEPAPDGTPIVYTRMEGCMLSFCKSLTRVERLETDEPHLIRTTTLPERSDFKFAESEWQLTPVEGGTEIIYELVMEPDFWVPPLIGPWIMKRELRQGGERAIYRIERLALGLPTGLRPARGVDEASRNADRADAEPADAERADAERADAERADAERADAERVDAERDDAERADAAPADTERADLRRARER